MAFRVPLRCGRRKTTYYDEHAAILRELERGFDTATGTELEIETRADALAVAMIRAVNARVENQNFPRRMLENLPVWEEALRLRPSPEQYPQDRRRVVEGTLRGLGGNSAADIGEAAERLLGVYFEGSLVVVEAAELWWGRGGGTGPAGGAGRR